MPDSMYPGMDEESSPSETPESEMEKDDKEESETALLPKSFFEGQTLKPGEQYYVEIVRSYEDEVEVRYKTQDPEETKKETMEEESPNSKLEALGTNPKSTY